MCFQRVLMAIACLAVAWVSTATAQTVTVGAAGDFPTLQQAINSFRVTTAGVHASDPAPNVINLLDNTTTEATRVYISPEITNTTGGLTIKSLAPQGHTVLLIPSAATTYTPGLTSVGYFTIYNDGYVEVEGLRILPVAATTTRGIYVEDNTVTSTLTTPHTVLRNVWVTPNASGQPASDGFTAPAGITAALNNIACIGVASGSNGRSPLVELEDVRTVGGGYGLQAFNSNVKVGPGCVFAYANAAAGSIGVQVNQTVAGLKFEIEGTAAKPVWVHSNNSIGLDVGTSASGTANVKAQWLRVLANGGNGYDQSSGGVDSISNAIFALNSGASGNFYFYSNQDTTDTVLSEVTFHNASAAGAPAFWIAGSSPSSWVVEGSVFSASGSTNDDLLRNSGTVTTSTVTIRHSAIVTTGLNSLSTDDADGIRDTDIAKFIIEASVIGADPAYESTTPTDANFLYIANGSIYTTAGIAGGILRGGTDQLTVPVELSHFDIE